MYIPTHMDIYGNDFEFYREQHSLVLPLAMFSLEWRCSLTCQCENLNGKVEPSHGGH